MARVLSINPINPDSRSEQLGRFPTYGNNSPIVLDALQGFIFKYFMVTVGGNVEVEDMTGGSFTYPACQPGTQYMTLGQRILSLRTTATGIYVHGGV